MSRFSTDPTQEPDLRGSQRSANFRLRRKVIAALRQIADHECISRGAVLSTLILKRYRELFGKDVPKDSY